MRRKNPGHRVKERSYSDLVQSVLDDMSGSFWERAVSASKAAAKARAELYTTDLEGKPIEVEVPKKFLKFRSIEELRQAYKEKYEPKTLEEGNEEMNIASQ